MFRYAIIFLVIAIVAAALGFGAIASFSFEIGKFIAVIALIIFVVLLIMGRGRTPRV